MIAIISMTVLILTASVLFYFICEMNNDRWFINYINKTTIEKKDLIPFLSENGNAGFNILGAKASTDAAKLNAFGNFLSVWSNELAYNDKDIYDTILAGIPE